MSDLTVTELYEMLSYQQPVTVLDVRRTADYEEWFIPGSVHVDVYDALKAGDPHALDHLDLPHNQLVVTVCGLGKTSQIAAALLQKRGYKVRSLYGGFKAWSEAWNTAELSLPNAVQIIQVRRTGKGCLSYLIGSQGQAAVIDASLDPQIYLQLAAQKGWHITYTFDTHIHADHLSRSKQLAERCGAVFYLPQQERVAYPYRPVQNQQRFCFGAVELTAVSTPGHTLESVCYELNGQVLLTGDTLFLNGFGRPDLEASPAEAQQRASLLYHSLHQLIAYPAETTILPGHTSTPAPFDQVIISAPLGEITAQIPHLALAEPAFVTQILQKIPPTPPNYQQIVQFNEQGNWPADPLDLEAGANRCAIQ